MRTPGKVLSVACPAAAGAAVGYVYLVGVLQPVRRVPACPAGQLNGLRCTTYEVIVSTPFFLVIGAMVGLWLGYAAVKLYSAPGRRTFTRPEGMIAGPLVLAILAWIIALGTYWPSGYDTWLAWGLSLGWDYVLLFVLVAVLARLMVEIASIASGRGSLLFAFGMPAVFAGLGYAVPTVLPHSPAGHGCPPVLGNSPGVVRLWANHQWWLFACYFHPVISRTWPWVVLGLLAGTWLAFAIAIGVAASPSRALQRAEVAIVSPAIALVLWWAVVIGTQQAGGGYVDLFVGAVAVTVLLRLLIGTSRVRTATAEMLTRLGMVTRAGTAAG